MKPSGRHRERILTAIQVKQIKVPGRYADGGGLYLQVDPSLAKRWLLRTVVHGRRRDIGLGSLQLVSLAEAREMAHNMRKVARAGGDPVAERKVAAAVPTFADAARAAHQEHGPTWSNKKHHAQWITTLEAYVFPSLGQRRVDQIETPDVLKVLAPIWLTKPETARRVKQRIGTVLDCAKAAGFRSGENPVNGVAKGLPRQPERKKHHATLPSAEVPRFIGNLRDSEASEAAKLAFEFLILTAARTNEVLQASWDEFEGRTWMVPAERMKAKREHRVPLCKRCLQILRRAKELSDGSDYVFPGSSRGKPLSNMVFLMMIRRMGLKITAHGFRSAFRDWASECTSFPTEVSEAALAHTVKNKVEAAYRRGDLYEMRRLLMLAWSKFATREQHRGRKRSSSSAVT